MDNPPREALSGVTAADLGWLEGRWIGRRGQDIIEEHWSAPAGAAIMGMFRWLSGDKARFYELLTIEPAEDGRLLMRIKHFHPGLKGWEEKDQAVTLALVAWSQSSALWRQLDRAEEQFLVYRREKGDSLVAYFTPDGSPPPEEKRFVYWGT
jgi:hypothetical protein